ncbi:MAG: RNA polymerase sigma factor [Planctomycetota bacterium]
MRKFDDESVRELMIHYRPLLHEIARRNWNRRYQPRLDPSDALQLTWTSMVLSARGTRFENRDHFMGFLTKTLSNHLVNIHRSLYAKKRSVAREVDLIDSTQKTVFEFATNAPSNLDELIERELVCETLQAILRLPRELQHLLRWRFRKGMSYSEIANKIDRTDDEVRHLVDKCVRAICRDLRIRAGVPR